MATLRISWDEPTSWSLELDQVKDFCRLDHDELDDQIANAMIPGSIRWAEGFTRRSLINRAHRLVLSGFPQTGVQQFRLPRGKTQGVSSIDYVSNTVTTTLTGPSTSPAGTDWIEALAGDAGGLLMPPQAGSWPSTDANVPEPVIVNFTAGWTAAELPQDLKLACYAWILDRIDGVDSNDPQLADRLASSWILRGA